MTDDTRRAKIEAMLASEPQDVFLRYSLAMEMTKDGEVQQALELYAALAAEDPPHVPAFFRTAQILADGQQVAAARTALRDGIEAARQQGDMHAAGEMSEMLSELGQLGE